MKSALVFSSGVLATKGSQFDLLWEQWKVNHDKSYEPASETHRREIFQKNVEFVERENNKGLNYTLGLNQFSDLTNEEFSAKMVGGYKPSLRQEGVKSTPWVDLDIVAADSIDWVEKGGVNSVKNQQQCGSCWAFSTVAAVEGAYFVSSGTLLSLSEQELVSCDKGDDGCNGGLMDNAFKFLETTGLCTEAEYPYTAGGGKRGECQKSCTPQVKVTSFVDVPSGKEDKLKQALTQQPVSVAIDAEGFHFQAYSGGVFDKCAGTQLDHGVAAVGYGTDGGKPYWKVRNSWGSTWGEKGYIRMIRGKDECGIAKQASYPSVEKASIVVTV